MEARGRTKRVDFHKAMQILFKNTIAGIGWKRIYEVRWSNGGCISRSAVVGGEVGSSGESHCHSIVLVGGWGKTKFYKCICLPNQRRRSNLAEEEVKREVDENCE